MPRTANVLFEMLKPFRDVLLLSAHSHTQSHVRHGPATDWHGAGRLHEYNAGATCGAYWSGIKDAEGIPDSDHGVMEPQRLCQACHHSRDDYRLNWFNARQQPNQAMALHAPKVLRRGVSGIRRDCQCIHGQARHRSRGAHRQRGWQPMDRVSEQPIRVVLAINAMDDAAEQLRAYDRMPEATDSKHLWHFALYLPICPKACTTSACGPA